MERWTYDRPFELVDIPDSHFVVLADYVTTEDGTGLVHQSPAFGAEDLAVARAYGLPVVNPVLPDGTFAPDVPLIGGLFFKKADDRLVPDLEQRGLLFKHVPYEHSYPHCWRCHTVLIYYAQPSWYIRTTAIKDALLRENERTDWYPETIKWGSYGDWLNNNIDWALSRNRFWGTPLPIWVCAQSHHTCVGLDRRAVRRSPAPDLSGARPAPPVRRRRHLRLPGVRRGGATRPRGHRRLVRLRLDALRAVGLPARSRAARRRSRTPTRRSTSARRSTRPAAGSTR